MCWNDPFGVAVPNTLDPTNKALVNDLDLRVEDQVTMTTTSPWILALANPANAATKGDNTTDNCEQVVIDPAVNARAYKISITHKGSLQDPQGVCLVTSGTSTGLEFPPPRRRDDYGRR